MPRTKAEEGAVDQARPGFSVPRERLGEEAEPLPRLVLEVVLGDKILRQETHLTEPLFGGVGWLGCAGDGLELDAALCRTPGGTRPAPGRARGRRQRCELLNPLLVGAPHEDLHRHFRAVGLAEPEKDGAVLGGPYRIGESEDRLGLEANAGPRFSVGWMVKLISDRCMIASRAAASLAESAGPRDRGWGLSLRQENGHQGKRGDRDQDRDSSSFSRLEGSLIERLVGPLVDGPLPPGHSSRRPDPSTSP